MADTIKSSSDLKITWKFTDGDTRTNSIKNPRSDITKSEMQTFANNAVTNQILIGDKAGAALTGIKTAYIDEKTIVNCDIGA